MKQLELINFVDAESHQNGIAVVRAGEGEVGLTLSLEEDGDTEVFLRAEDCERLLDALRQALAIAKQKTVLAA